MGIRLALVIAALLLPASLDAQVLYGSITGNVTDMAGLAMPSATVDTLNTETGITRQTKADSRGAFAFNDLQQGLYKVTVSAAGFSTAVENNVQLDANTVRRVDVSLAISQANQSVTVDASAVTLQADRVTVNTQISEKEIEDLPITGARNFQSLLDLVPGVTPPAASHSEAGNPTGALATNVNGASYNNNGTRVDGAVNSYPWLPEIVAYVPPAESIQAVSVSTGNYDAEQGFAGGSAVNVTMKSGANSFHGAAWEYNTVSKLNAKNFFYRGSPNIPKFISNQFGLTFGGPIRKNKLFFFADWERIMKRQAASGTYSVPLPQMRQGDFSFTTTKIYDPATGNPSGTGRTQFPKNIIPVSRLSSAALMMAKLLPLPNDGTGSTSNYFGVGDYYANKDNIDIKINYNPNQKSMIFVRYSELPYNLFDPPDLGAGGGTGMTSVQPGNSSGTVRNVALGSTYIITPSLLADGNIGFTRQAISGKDVDIGKNYGSDVLKIPGTNGSLNLQGGYPYFAVTDYTAFGNPAVSNPFLFRDNQFIYGGNLSWIKGSHSMRFGVDFVDYQINHFQPQLKWGARGGFGFVTIGSDGDAEHFGEGLEDQLIDALSIIPQLRVAPRSSTFSFRAKASRDAREVGRLLNTVCVLDGSVRRAGPRLRISVRLILVADGQALWSERFDRAIADIFEVQDEITGAVVAKLRSRLLGELSGLPAPALKRSTEDPEAYGLYLKGRHHWNKRPTGTYAAIDCFQKALVRDPKYALAHASLADCYNTLGSWEAGMLSPEEAYSKGRAYAERSLQLDPNLAEGHTALGYGQLHFEWNLRAAERSMTEALRLNPAYGAAHHWYSHLLIAARRFEESREHSLQYLAFDPTEPKAVSHLCWHHLMSHDFSTAERECRAAVSQEPNFAWHHAYLGWALLASGRLDEAHREMEEGARCSGGLSVFQNFLTHVRAVAGHLDLVAADLDRLEEISQQQYISPYETGLIQEALGNRTVAFRQWELAFEQRSPWLVYLASEPRLMHLSGDPQYIALVGRIQRVLHRASS